MKIIAKIDFAINDTSYIAGEEIKNFDYNKIVKLNESGFIEPLSYKDLVLLKREFDKKKEEL